MKPMGDALLRAFPWLDAVFSGEADRAFPDSAKALISGRGGLSMGLLDCGEFPDIGAVPRPDYDDYFDLILHLQGPEGLPRGFEPILYFESSRGCWWGGRSTRVRSAA
ncbi:MAG: hypothetical protein FJZ01_25675 [Candidatus Sericytochromatia bacterium]|nr:hypothetical protein [Candidatus Tanganyikabacteria bacterium]